MDNTHYLNSKYALKFCKGLGATGNHPEYSDEISACVQIIEYLKQHLDDQVIYHLTISKLRHLTGFSFTDETLIRAAIHLAHIKDSLLQVGFEYINEEGMTVTLEKDELELINTEDVYVDRYSGEEFTNAQESTFMYFFATEDIEGKLID